MNHAEAFKLMRYECKACQSDEVIWNSRDGVTPFGVDCRLCGGEALHVNWREDRFAPQHDPQAGDRYFRDGLPEEARAIMRWRLERAKGTKWEVPEEEWSRYTDAISDSGEFQPGWPMLVVRGTDADSLPLRSTPPGPPNPPGRMHPTPYA